MDDTLQPSPPRPSVWCDPCRSAAGLSEGSGTPGILARPYRALTVGVIALVALGAFETFAVATAMPVVVAALDGRGAYALAFGVPTATGIVGMVLGGLWSDARGPGAAVRAGVGLFVAGLLLCGLAPSMAVLVGGRAVQGLGTGLLGVALYVVVGRCYPDGLRARMFAAFAAAWVLPSLVGPLVSGLVAEQLGWRWVFLAVAAVSVPAAVPVLRRLAARSAAAPVDLRRLVWAALAGTGVALLQLAGQLPVVVGGTLGVAAAVAVAGSAPRLLPAGTLRARRGLPTTVLLRGLGAGGFVGAQTLLPLLLVEQRGLSATIAGLFLTTGSIAWAAASWARGRLPARHEHRLLRLGMVTLTGGIVSAVALVVAAGPTWAFLVSWVGASAGMGVLVPTLSVLALRQAPAQEHGAVGSALQTSDALFAALALALTGTVFGRLLGGAPLVAFATALALAAALPLLGSLLSGRSGRRPSDPAPPGSTAQAGLGSSAVAR